MRRLLFLISELSSQFGRDLRILRKRLPPGLHYMTGDNVHIRVNINPNEPVQVVHSITGNIIAIIDGMGYIRPILNASNQLVQILPRRNNYVSVMRNSSIQHYQIEFNVRPPATGPIHNPNNNNYHPNNNNPYPDNNNYHPNNHNHYPNNNNHYPNRFMPYPNNTNFDRSR